MRMRLFFALLLFALVSDLAGRAGDDKKPKVEDFLGVWIEEKFEVDGGANEDAWYLSGWDFAEDDGGCWLRRGEAVYSSMGKVRVRTDKNPVWLDFIGECEKVKTDTGTTERVWMLPGIVKRDGGKLVWVRSKEWQHGSPREIAEWGKRPKSFDVKKGDPWYRITLRRGDGRYATD